MSRDLHRTFGTAGGNILLLKLPFGNFLLLGLLDTTAGEGPLILHEADLDMAGAAHVRVDPTVSPICSTPHLGSAVNL